MKHEAKSKVFEKIQKCVVRYRLYIRVCHVTAMESGSAQERVSVFAT